MKPLICLTVVHLCLGSAFARATSRMVTEESFETACDYPGVLTLISSSGEKQVDANNCDAEFEKAEWHKVPTIKYPDADPGKSYTLVHVDPDPPGFKDGQYYLHWLVSNIKGEDFAKGDLSKANQLEAYHPPAPPPGSGLHRYMYLAFEEEREDQKVERPSRRSKFELAPWLERQDDLYGPVAGIQYRTKF